MHLRVGTTVAALFGCSSSCCLDNDVGTLFTFTISRRADGSRPDLFAREEGRQSDSPLSLFHFAPPFNSLRCPSADYSEVRGYHSDIALRTCPRGTKRFSDRTWQAYEAPCGCLQLRNSQLENCIPINATQPCGQFLNMSVTVIISHPLYEFIGHICVLVRLRLCYLTVETHELTSVRFGSQRSHSQSRVFMYLRRLRAFTSVCAWSLMYPPPNIPTKVRMFSFA